MNTRTTGLVFVALILIILFPTLNTNLESATAAGGAVNVAIRILVKIGVAMGVVSCLGMAAYEVWKQ